jgi:hypothetical protein
MKRQRSDVPLPQLVGRIIDSMQARFVKLHSESRNAWYGAKSVQDEVPYSWLTKEIVDLYDLRMELFSDPVGAPFFHGRRSLGTVTLVWSEQKWTKAMRTKFYVTDYHDAADMTIGTTLKKKVRERRRMADSLGSGGPAQSQAPCAYIPTETVSTQPHIRKSAHINNLQSTDRDTSALQRLIAISSIVLTLSYCAYAYVPRHRHPH